VFNGRIDIEKINEPFLYKLKGHACRIQGGLSAPSPRAGCLHESGTFVKFTEAGAALFA
jgi:hypothetical protein